MQPGADVTASPFVRVFQLIGVPAAAHIVNFVVLTAALSSMNCNLYLATRMIFSLARGGYAPRSLGRVSARGTPVRALIVTTFGLLVAVVMAIVFPNSAYVYLFGIALFGGLFVWFMIFVSHLFFRRKWEARRPSLAGAHVGLSLQHAARRSQPAGHRGDHMVGAGDAGNTGGGVAVASCDLRCLSAVVAAQQAAKKTVPSMRGGFVMKTEPFANMTMVDLTLPISMTCPSGARNPDVSSRIGSSWIGSTVRASPST